MKKLFFIGIISLLVSACSGNREWGYKSRTDVISHPLHALSEGEHSEILSFSWPVPSEAEIEEKVRLGAMSMRLRYNLLYESNPFYQIIHFKNVRVLELNGQKPTNRIMGTRALAYLTWTKGLFPSFRVDNDGDFVEIIRPGKAYEKFVHQHLDEKAQKEYQSPQFKENFLRDLENRMKAMWNLWVRQWVDLKIFDARTREFYNESWKFKLSEPLFGAKVRRSMVVKREYNKEDPSKLKLQLYSENSGPRFVSRLVNALNDKVETWDEPMIVSPEDLDDLYEKSHYILELEPRTLRPHSLKMDQTLKIKWKNRSEKSERKEHSLQFKWNP